MTAASGHLVSVVIPCHNGEAFVGDAVRSALAQDGVDVEVIVVDDGSTDDTPRVLEAFGDTIRVIRNRQPTERGAARNLGARSASGDFIAFLDADDRWLPGKARAQLRLVHDAQVSLTEFEYVDGQGRVTGHARPPWAATLDLVVSRPVAFGAGSNLMVSRQTFDQSGGFPEDRAVQGCEDWLFMAVLLSLGAQVAVVSEPLVQVMVHDAQSTATAARRAMPMWAAAAWLEANGHVQGHAALRLRAHVAGVLAAGFAFEGDTRLAAHWVGQAARQGASRETALAAARVAISGGTGALRRHGLAGLVEAVRGTRRAVSSWKRS